MSRKRILIDANPVVPYFVSGRVNGIGRTTIELIKELDKVRDSLPFDIILYTQNIKGVSAKQLSTGFKSRHLYLRDKGNWNSIIKTLHLRELLTGYDLQHITHNWADVADPSRTILTIHDAMFYAYPESHLDNGFQYAEKVTSLAKKAKTIITISENSKRDIVKFMGVDDSKIHVIPWGVDRTIFRPHTVLSNKWSGINKYFLSVSCDQGRKNTISLIKAYIEFSKKLREHDLILVGRYPTSEMKSLVKDHGLDGRVHFVSGISDRELSDLYAGATVTFFPSLYEGFGLPILESFACGTPCVTANNSSLPEVGGEAAIYVDPLDILAIASEMKKFEEQYGLSDIEQFMIQSLRQADKFTWKNTVDKTIDVYKSCL